MNIGKAIEILSILAHDIMPPDIDDFNKALDLGIEALKRQILCRDTSNDCDISPLPGETKE